MRLLLIVPSLLLMAPALGSEKNAAPPTPAVAAPEVHGFCGDDSIAPTVERILPGYGDGGLKIAAKPEAQAFFNNGMQLAHSFAHKAATGAFAESVRLDPLCVMCVWGKAWSEGPTINFPIDAATQVKAGKQVATALRLAATGSPFERRMLEALALRYQGGGGKGSGDIAFARAMDAIAGDHPDSNELATIAADAWMIPAALRENRDNLPRAVALLEGVLRRDPNYTPAIHFYIHATEMMGYPKRAEPFANRLPKLAPAASHLLHMPSHTFYWVGRYQDATEANVQAAALAVEDARIAGLRGDQRIWQLDYHAHNVQFGVGGALISGDGASALTLADPMLAAMLRGPAQSGYGMMAAGTAYAAEGRFATPAAVLALPDPGAQAPLARVFWHYARGEAQARLGNANAVRAEMAAIVLPPVASGADKPLRAAHDMARIAQLVLLGRAEMIAGRPTSAIAAYARATRIEESKLVTYYADPPAWWYPVRRSLAAALLDADRPTDALVQADIALRRRPADPVTLALRDRIAATLANEPAPRPEALAKSHGWRGDPTALSLPLI